MDQQILQAAYKAYAPHNNNINYGSTITMGRLAKHMRPQQYTNIVKRGIDMGS